MPDYDLSSHPVDRLVRELIDTRRNIEPDEFQRILDRIATARFDTRERLGPRWLPELFVVYSADRGIIVSGYQVESLATISIPEDAQWLP